ncbi:MAG: hypothetical protein ACKOXP_09845 [Flavobacteriales bacterium]
MNLESVHAQLNAKGNDLRLGIQVQGNKSFLSVSDQTFYNKDYFDTRKVGIGLGFAVQASFQHKRWIYELSNRIQTNHVGLNYFNNLDYARINIRTVSLQYDFGLGFQIGTWEKYETGIFLMAHYSFGMYTPQMLSAQSRSYDFLSFTYHLPGFEEVWQVHHLGLGVKFRSNKHAKFHYDYGLTYQYGVQTFPTMTLSVINQNIAYESSIKGNIHSLNLDFVYFFGSRKKHEAREK